VGCVDFSIHGDVRTGPTRIWPSQSGDTLSAWHLLAAYVRQEEDTAVSGVRRSLQDVMNPAYGESTAKGEVPRRLQDDAYPRGGLDVRLRLQVNPKPEAVIRNRRHPEEAVLHGIHGGLPGIVRSEWCGASGAGWSCPGPVDSLHCHIVTNQL